jgi:hypothetical protein
MYIPRSYKIGISVLVVGILINIYHNDIAKFLYFNFIGPLKDRKESNYTSNEGEFVYDGMFKIKLPSGHGIIDEVDDSGKRKIEVCLGTAKNPYAVSIYIFHNDGQKPENVDNAERKVQVTETVFLGKPAYFIDAKIILDSNKYLPVESYKFTDKRISVRCYDIDHPKVKYVFEHWEWLEESESQKDK